MRGNVFATSNTFGFSTGRVVGYRPRQMMGDYRDRPRKIYIDRPLLGLELVRNCLRLYHSNLQCSVVIPPASTLSRMFSRTLFTRRVSQPTFSSEHLLILLHSLSAINEHEFSVLEARVRYAIRILHDALYALHICEAGCKY